MSHPSSFKRKRHPFFPKFIHKYFIMSQSSINPSLKIPANLTNPSLKHLNESYASKIAQGEIEVTKEESKSKLTASENYDRLMKAKKLAEAEREKKELERKLEYLNRSIQSIKDYDFSTGKIASANASPSSKQTPSPPKTMQELRKKVKEYQNELNKKRQQARQRKLQQQEQRKKASEKEEESKKAQRRQKIFQNMQKIKKRIEDRESSAKKQEQEYRRVVLNKSLHEKLQQSFEQKQASMLEERKKKLADIRNLHRPISLSEIADHEKTFMEVLKEKQSMRERERRINNSGEEYRVSYRSPTYMKVAKGEKEPREDESRIKADKMRQFSQHVRDNFVPIIDERKRESLEKMLQEQREKKERQNAKKEEDAQRVEEIRSKGLRYLEEVKDLPKRKNSSGQTSPQSERVHYKNYLTHSQRSSGGAWHSILSGTQDKKEKAMRLQAEAERFEGGLRMREKKARLLKEDPGEIDQEYYDMIKAKLDLLQI